MIEEEFKTMLTQDMITGVATFDTREEEEEQEEEGKRCYIGR